MSSEKFEDLEDDFKTICGEVERKINEKLVKAKGEEKKKLYRELQKQLDKTESLLNELDAEVRLAPQSFRNEMSYRLRRYRQQSAQLYTKLKNSYAVESPGRYDAYDGTNPFVDTADSQARGVLLQTDSVLNRTTDRIRRTQEIAAETEGISHAIVTDLGEQREALIRTRDRLEDTDQTLGRSRRILNAMARSFLGNKLLLLVVILIEIAIFSGVLYIRFIHKKK